MNKLGFTFYPKDWWTSDMFFELDSCDRYIYLEMLFYMYQNDGYLNVSREQFQRRLITEIKPRTWEKITQKLTRENLGYTHESVIKRQSRASASRSNGKKGGRPKKPRNLALNPPLEYKEKENINIKEINKEKETQLLIDRWILELPNHHTYLERLYMTNKLQKGTIGVLARKFKEHLKVYPPTYTKFDEFRRHFGNWINIQIQNNKLGDYTTKRAGSI